MKRLLAWLLALAAWLLLCGGALAEDALDGAERTALQYAEQFTLDRLPGGCTLLTIAKTDRFLVVPEGGEAPQDLPADVTVLYQPLERIYLAATSAMDPICALDAVGSVTLSGTQESGWYIQAAVEAMQSGAMRYAGKYSAPDFEMIVDGGCQLAIESTMIYHTPDVKEQLEALGVPVLVERSSYESHPLGRMEWIKFYGVLLGREEEAERIYQAQMEALEDVLVQQSTGKTVAFFYINSMGLVNVRKPGDYIVKVIELAGGEYAITSLQDDGTALSTVNMQMEDFYADAMDADYLIYNSTIAGELTSLDALLARSELLATFKAVREGNVYCTEQNLFQESMGLGQLILDIHEILTSDADTPQDLTYLYKLE